MRALCGAIISAGALIGLGLLSIGIGQRYSLFPYHNRETDDPQWVHLNHLDTALLVPLVTLLMVLVIGLGIAFLGLAYHHHHRHHELLHLQRQAQHPPQHPTDRPPQERMTL